MSNIEPVRVIGFTPGTLEISRIGRIALSQADLVVGDKHLLAACPKEALKHGSDRLTIAGSVQPIMDTIRKRAEKGDIVVVLADGDPLFFGIGKCLREELGSENLKIEPTVSTVQVAAARLGLPWQEMDFVSLHGHGDFSPLYAALVRSDFIAVFTDKINTPSEIARALLERGADCFTMTVLEELGTPEEQIQLIPLPDTWGMDFAPRNLVVLERQFPPEIQLTLGIPDHCYLHQHDLITKLPVRATGLAFLQVKPESTIWALGTGSGAVAIEASHLARSGRVFAVEQHKTRAAMIRENIRRTGAWLVETVHGPVPECLVDLPAPDRIFVGSGLDGPINQEKALLKAACKQLLPRGRIVVHSSLLDSLHLVKDHFKKLGWYFGVTQLHPSTTDSLAGDLRFKAQNPVFILWAEKP